MTISCLATCNKQQEGLGKAAPPRQLYTQSAPSIPGQRILVDNEEDSDKDLMSAFQELGKKFNYPILNKSKTKKSKLHKYVNELHLFFFFLHGNKPE